MSARDASVVALRGSRLVEASAGTGKTFTIALLYLRLVMEEGLRPGQILGLHRAVKGIARYESVEVVTARSNCAMVRNRLGEVKRITAKHAGSFEVYERRTIEVFAGDRLLLTVNRREPGFRATNGEIVTVRSVDQQGRIQLLDGRTLPDNYKQFAHGYAVTAHRSQGKSVDSVVISGDGMSRELFYVAASRGRESAVVVTGDKELLRRSVARSVAPAAHRAHAGPDSAGKAAAAAGGRSAG